ncbi:hypothetical protein DXT99_26790 [Pontibacter diazotrophicus]|uniref:DUF4595 domain-containing protein n=2 Tax=Pontibacter diazotrophicus TaxID=1400979 RepID=A0A3D8KYU0_9BACT|nr:hypothetical protein DXT99_26790 [Pontibacter diazotrophicus]
MKKIPILLCMLLLSQCKQKPLESKLNDSSFTQGEVINYQYDKSGRLVKENWTSCFMAGGKPDSLDIVMTYFYDVKGRKIKVEEHDGSDELISTTFFDYDLRDSLLSEYTIDIHRDTTLLVENSYGENGSLHLVKHRRLLNSQSVDDILNGNSNYDTLFTLTENFYQAGFIIKSTDRDSQNALVAEREYEYDGQKLAGMTVYEFPDSKKQLSLTHFYLLPDNSSNVEKVTLNILGDTVGIKQVEKYGNGKIAKLTEVEGLSNVFITNFDEQGQITTEIAISMVVGEKSIEFFTYDSSGRKIKVVSRHEPLTEKEKNML